MIEHIKTVIILAFLVFASWALVNSDLFDSKERYRMVLSKSSMTRDIVRDTKTGCEYIREEGKPLEPLMIDGKHVCEEE